MVITRASQARDVSSILIARSPVLWLNYPPFIVIFAPDEDNICTGI